ncbi:hypothetical protein BpHYR1_035601 [Brachionus plicatilis]|uniref:Uncharacterized protein n=1 Tax=Brachionus plicatilis TaxID=10195 RepID=A0A3M7R2F7_BRAPC|nr:hypothetical protein BpHYR1_035601 [Brachionus plicatilis]
MKLGFDCFVQEDGSIEGEILVIVIDDTFLIEPEGKSDACKIDERRGGVIIQYVFSSKLKKWWGGRHTSPQWRYATEDK